ncbi:MAG: PAS domain S-box protein [Thermodesulfobacteriota bacterium]
MTAKQNPGSGDDSRKTRAQLIDELERLRHRLDRLENEIRSPGNPDLASLIANVGDVFIRYGLDLRFRHVDPKIEKILPIRAVDWIGKAHAEAGLPAELAGYFDDTLKTVRDTGRPATVEFEMDAIDGRRHFESVAYPEFGTDGAVKTLVTVTRDVTARKRIETELRNREEHIRSINSHLIGGMIYQIVRAPSGARKFTYLGDNVKTFYGITPEQGMADPDLIYGRVHEDDRERVHRDEEQAFCSMSTFRTDARIKAPDGGTRWSRFVSTPRRLENGSTLWDGIEFDITDRKLAEEALRESEERYRAFAQASFEGLMIHEKGVIQDANQTFAELFGFVSPESLIGRHFFDVLPLTAAAKEKVRRQLCDPRDIIAEISITLPDGSMRWLETQGRHFTYRGRTARAVTIRDISDRKQMEEERLKSQRLEAIGVLAGGIAHDFNNILTGVMGNLSIALLDLERGADPRETLEAAEKASIQARDLTAQLLTFARGGAPVLRPASVRKIIEEAVSFAGRGANVRCDLTFTDDLLPANIDPGQIGRVIHNIILNSIQAMPGGGLVRVGAKNFHAPENNPLLLPPGSYILLTIADQGPGILPENLPRIFDPYFTTKSSGTGLGLATCHSIVNRHGGKITAESEPDRGAIFRVYLPAAAEPVKPEAPVSVPAGGQGRILLMDDDESVRKVARLILEKAGYEVEESAEGKDAVGKYRAAMAASRPFGAVIFDLTIPGGMGGKDAVAEIRKFDPSVKAVVASGYSNDPVLSDFAAYGFSAKVAKPYNTAEIMRAVAEALA